MPVNAGRPLASPPAPPLDPDPGLPATLSENVSVGFPPPLEQPDKTPPEPAVALPNPALDVPAYVVVTVEESLEANPGTTIPAAVISGAGPPGSAPGRLVWGLSAPPGISGPEHVGALPLPPPSVPPPPPATISRESDDVPPPGQLGAFIEQVRTSLAPPPELANSPIPPERVGGGCPAAPPPPNVAPPLYAPC
jgi:hypothetical protein